MMQIGSLLLLFFVIFLGMLTKKWPLRPSPLAAANPTLDAGALMMGVIVGTNGVVLSPFSTVGALACGCAPERVDVNKLYKNLLITAILFSLSAFVVSYLGIYTKFFL